MRNRKILSVPAVCFRAVLYGCVSFAVVPLLDGADPDRLIAVGAALIVSSVAADAVMQWLKQVGSRLRPKYLLTLDDPASEFRNWWQMIPHLAGSVDSYQSWPSGHMSIVGVMFALPVLTDYMKIRSDMRPRINMLAFCFACVFMLLCGYNRMHMTNHFLSDVCFGTLHTYLITAGICTFFTGALPGKH